MPPILALLHCLPSGAALHQGGHLSQVCYARFLAMAYALTGTVLSALWLVEIAWPIHPLLRLIQPTALHVIVMG